MTTNENWVKNNSEVETEEKENGAVILTGAEEEKIVEDENTSDDVVEVVDETSEETEDEVADDATDDETAETEESEEAEEEENSDENSEDENTDSNEETKEGMSRTEKIVLTALALILFLLLIWFGVKVYNNIQRGAGDAHNLNNSQINTTQTDNNGGSDDENGANDGANDGIVDDQNDGTDDSSKNTDNRPGKPTSNKTNSDEDGNNDDGNNKKNNSTTDSADDGKNDGDNSDKGDNGNNGNKNDNDDNGNNKDNGVSEYAGDTTVRITKITDDTGIITVTVDGEKIVVPVQTTVFNGRVTKSGVAQGKLFGFNCGATVMLYYPQEDGMNNTEFSGYMNRTSDSLTILVDINGNNSKLLIKINGLKSL